MAENMSSACTVDGCNHGAVAKGLCAKHYARARRTGDPNKTRRAGRPRSGWLEYGRHYFGTDWSPRTIARLARAERLMKAATGSFEEWIEESKAIKKRAKRPNGQYNVSQIEREAELFATWPSGI
jgi:hypothetical protein